VVHKAAVVRLYGVGAAPFRLTHCGERQSDSTEQLERERVLTMTD
jgi:hypothetical protein